jgi:hypothetical protein
VLKAWKFFVFGGILGLGIGAAQLLPTIEYFNDSERVNFGIKFVGWGSLNPLEFFQWFAPYIYKGLFLFSEGFASGTHEFGLYEGFFAAFAMIWLFIERPQNTTKKVLVKLGVLFLFLGFFLSIGKFNGLFYFYGLFKPFSLFRYHSRNRVLISFGASLLSAVAFSEMLEGKVNKKEQKLYFVPNLLSSMIALVALSIKHFRPDLSHQFFSSPLILFFPVFFFVLGLVFYLGWLNKRSVLMGLLVLTVVDRSIYQLSFAFHDVPQEINWKSYGKLKENRKPDLGNWSLIEGGRLISGYLGVAQRRSLDYASKKAQQAAAVESPENFPRYWMVTQTFRSQNPAKDIELIDLSTTALVDENLELVSGEKGQVKELTESPGRLEFLTNTKLKQLLVVSESFHRGWRLTVDGVKTTLRKVNGDFIGVVVEPGEHRIKLQFRPWSLIWGIGISGISTAAVFLLFWVSKKIPQTVAKSKAVPFGG